MGKKNAATDIRIEDFTKHPEVVKCIDELTLHFTGKGKTVSDIVDGKGHQYVNLVQEGGGVLGVALVGYTYALEKAGIRFLRLAGTSAGAINTMLLTCITEEAKKKARVETKSEVILDELARLNLFDFVDGHPFVKRVIGLFVSNKSLLRLATAWAKRAFIALAVLLVVDVVSLGLRHHILVFSKVARVSFVLTGVLVLVCAWMVLYGNFLFHRFKQRGFGINPGKRFHDWIKGVMGRHGIHTVAQLNTRAAEAPKDLRNRVNPNDTAGLKADVTLITSDIVSQNKVEFPRMVDLYSVNASDESCRLHPADFVRASMSIPVFFESFFVNEINGKEKAIKDSWQAHFGTANVPASARFVDGGILSNFPISIFYDKTRTVARMPTFGIRLNDVDPKEAAKGVGDLSLAGYMGRMFNTVRFFYDKDFLLKNHVFGKGIGEIDVHEFNWLNFNLSKKDKIDLFVLGVKAVKTFLVGEDGSGGFNWNDYKAEREELPKKLNAAQNAAAIA